MHDVAERARGLVKAVLAERRDELAAISDRELDAQLQALIAKQLAAHNGNGLATPPGGNNSALQDLRRTPPRQGAHGLLTLP